MSNDFEDRASALSTFILSYDRDSLKKISPLSLLRFLLHNAFQDIRSPEYKKYLSGHLSKRDISARLQQQRDRLNDNCYSGLTINNFGDESCNTGRENLPLNPQVLEPAFQPSVNSDKIDPNGYISRFVDASNSVGAKIIPIYPVSTRSKYSEDKTFMKSTKEIKKFWENKGIEFHDTLQDSLLDPSLMYNTPYHPKDSGRQLRTKNILKSIEKLRISNK
jgi:hypothetical protein